MKAPRKRIDEVFSRHMLGSVLVGSAAGKVVEKSLNVYFNTTVSLLFGWSIAFILFLGVFVYWDSIERKIEEATDDE